MWSVRQSLHTPNEEHDMEDLKVVFKVQSYNENWEGVRISDHALYTEALWAAQAEQDRKGAKGGSILEHVSGGSVHGHEGTTVHYWQAETDIDGFKDMFVRNVADRHR
jgi:hypothetical protein